jgi:hypothetical protein
VNTPHKAPPKKGQGITTNGQRPSLTERGARIASALKKAQAPFGKVQQPKRPELPDPQDVLHLIDSNLPKPPELVCGILHRGSKFVIGGGSKSFKTWTLIDLSVSVATGTPWWGFDTKQGRVLYVNFEIQDAFFADRIATVLHAKECELELGQLSYWGLRGKITDFGDMMLDMTVKLISEDYSLIVIDPIYKGLGNRDENKAGDIASLLNEIERLAVDTGAAVAFGHHFSKGNQAGKESIDRIGGSGVFARDPDSILTMTKHKDEDAFTVDAVLRNFAPVESFVVRRMHPLMVRDDEADPNELKQPGQAQEKWTDDEILDSLNDGGMRTSEWMVDVMKRLGMSESSFHNRRRKLEAKDLIKKEGKEWVRVVRP